MGLKKNGTPISRACRFSFSPRAFLRGETPESATYVSLTEPLQCTVAKLTNTLARDAEHRADLLECVLASAFEAEVQSQHLRIPRRKRRQGSLDLVVEEAVHCLLLGVGHFVGDEPLDQRAIALRIHWRVEPHIARVERGE